MENVVMLHIYRQKTTWNIDSKDGFNPLTVGLLRMTEILAQNDRTRLATRSVLLIPSERNTHIFPVGIMGSVPSPNSSYP